MSASGTGLTDLADVLRWDTASPLPSLWLDRYDRRLAKGLTAVLSACEDAGISRSLSMLSDSQARRFLRAHSIAAELLKPSPQTAQTQWIASALRAELATLGLAPELEQKLWTAHGDRCLEPKMKAGWQTSGPAVEGSSILLDFFSPSNFGSRQPDKFSHFSDVECCVIANRIGRASSFVFQHSKLASDFVSSMLDVIAIRKTAAPEDDFSSSSFGRHARMMLIGLRNPESGDLAQLANSLVHESIHTLLFMFEETSGEFVDHAKPGNSATIRSPWSGRELDLDSCVHACVVWYGLFWFWNRPMASALVSRRRQQEMAELAQKGFLAQPVSRGLSEFAGYLSAPMLELLHAMEARMLAP
jgi:hypothetical protein